MNKAVSVLLACAAGAVLLVSCASGAQAKDQVAAPVAEVKYVDVIDWKTTRLETAYPDGVVSSLLVSTWDSAGNPVKEEAFGLKGAVVSVKTFKATANGFDVEVTNASGEIISRSVRELKDGKLVKETFYDPKGKIQSTEEHSWGENGEKTFWKVVTADGSTVSTEYVYEAGRLMRMFVRDVSGGIIKRFEKTYGPTGLLAGEEEFDSKGAVLRKTLKTYQNNLLAREEIRNATGSISQIIEYVNNADGNPETILFQDRTGKLIEKRSLSWVSFKSTKMVK